MVLLRFDFLNFDLEEDEFRERFSTEEACEEMLFQARWPKGFRCPKCGGVQAYFIHTRRLYECTKCYYQASLTAGTVFENTRTPLTKWFLAMYMMSRLEGINAAELHRLIQVTYKTAWTMMMKLRHVMGLAENQCLQGSVRFTNTIYGRNQLTLHSVREYSVLIAATAEEEHAEKIMMKRLADQQVGLLWPREIQAIHAKYFDTSPHHVKYLGIHHHKPFIRQLKSIVLQAQNWIHGTFIAIGEKHLHRYWDEYVYRYNAESRYRPILRDDNSVLLRSYGVHPRRWLMHDGKVSSNMFKLLLKHCSTTRTVTYTDIIHTPSIEHIVPVDRRWKTAV